MLFDGFVIPWIGVVVELTLGGVCVCGGGVLELISGGEKYLRSSTDMHEVQASECI